MENIIEDFLEKKEELTKELKKYVVDKSIPLNKRWSLFIKSGMGDHVGWIESFESLDSDFFGDSYLGEDRHRTITMSNLIDVIKDDLKNGDGKYKKYLNNSIEDLMEEILEKFIYSFEYDW